MGSRTALSTKTSAAKLKLSQKETPTSQAQKRPLSQPLPTMSLVDRVLFLQSTIGNRQVQRLIKHGTVEAKLEVGQPGDEYEQEADRTADAIMEMPEPHGQRRTENQSGAPHGRIEPGLATHISAMRGNGQPLPGPVRAFFEPRLGYDFSQVRVHTGGSAAKISREINAQAFTLGNDIVFGTGQYAPGTTAGQRLLAHELTHVIQQRHAPPLKNSAGKPSAKISRYAPAHTVQRHLSINNAVTEFKTKLGNPQLVKRGQFYWSYELKSAVKNEYQSILNTSWNTDPNKATLQSDLDALAEKCYDPRGQKSSITRSRTKILRFLSSSGNASAPQIKKIIGRGHYRTKKRGTSLFRKLWNEYQKTLSLPNLKPYAQFDRLEGLSLFEYIACWSAAERVPKLFAAKGGYSVGTRGSRTKIGGIGLCKGVRRDNTAVGGYKKGDVVTYGSLGSTINKMKTALDDGHIIHARVLSGVYAGSKPACRAEHSINVIGYDGNKFVFWDPDASESSEFGGGFGFLHHNSAPNRLTTAQNDADLKVDSDGDHAGGQHRYQVLSVRTVDTP